MITEARSLRALDDETLAERAASLAGEVLLNVRESWGRGSPGLGAAGDAASQRVLARVIRAARPGDAILSEESVDDLGRLTSRRVWIIDPLDGTREFGEAGRTDWAVHVALWERGSLVAGAVALPGERMTVHTGMPPALSSRAGRPRVAVSRTRAPWQARLVADALGGDLVPMGSAGAKVCAVIGGEVDAYVHAGGQYEWDSAAPVAVARASGLHASRIDGSPLEYNRADPYLPDLLVCRPEYTAACLGALRTNAHLVISGAAL